MRISITKKPFTGSIELLLVLPMIAIAAWGTGFIYSLLLEKGRIERAAWVYGMSVAHKTAQDIASEQVRPLWSAASSPPSIAQTTNCNELAASPGDRAFDLPISLSGYLVLHCALEFTFQTSQSLPASVIHFDLKREQQSALLDLSSRIVVPGSDLKGDDTFKQILWFEAMVESGNGRMPLQMLAVPELIKAAIAAGGGGNALGSEVTSLIGDSLSGEGLSDAIGTLTHELGNFKQLVAQEIKTYVDKAMENRVPEIPGSIPGA